jgi:UPF0755 protein
MGFRLFRGPLGWLAGLTLSAVVLLAGCAWWGWRAWTRPGPLADGAVSTVVNIPPGTTLAAAADTLVARGLLRDRRVLLAGARLTGQDRGLRAGLYELEYGASAEGLLANLTSGLSVQVKVTVPEGLGAEAIAEIVAEGLEFAPEPFLAAADSLVKERASQLKLLGSDQNVAAYDSLLAAGTEAGFRVFHWSEGYLAPDTYHFSAGTDPGAAAAHLVKTQLARLDSLGSLAGGINSMVENAHQLLTLASIVEAEARLDDERALVAAVYTNRLEKRWRLEADPTVAFVLDKKGQRLFYRDLEVASPFNTYRTRGLPPGPIGSPGRAALRAAAQPDTSCRAMYFVSDGQGGHVFSRTAREHEEAVQRFRRLKAAERRKGGD